METLYATGTRVPCGKPPRAPSHHVHLETFPRLPEDENDDVPRKMRRDAYLQASRAFKETISKTMSGLYAPTISELTDFFESLQQPEEPEDDGSPSPPWIPDLYASASGSINMGPKRLPVALVLHNVSHGAGFWHDLNRSFSQTHLHQVQLAGKECSTFRAGLQLLTRRLTEAAPFRRVLRGQNLPPTTLLDLEAHLRHRPCRETLIIHFPAAEEFPPQVLSELVYTVATSRLPVAILLGVSSLDAYEQAIRSPEVQSRLDVSRFVLAPNGPAEILSRLMLSLFLDTNDPPPLYLDSNTYTFLHTRFHEDNHDVNAFSQALELAALHHFHTRSLTAFAVSASDKRTLQLDPSSWTPKFLDTISDVLTSPSGAQTSAASAGDRLEAVSLRSLKRIPSPSPSTAAPLDADGAADAPSHTSSAELVQIPLFRSRIDSHHAWLARLVLLVSYANHFLNEDRLDSFDDLLGDVADYAQKAANKLVAGVNDDIYGVALSGDLEPKIRHMRSRMNELNSKQLSALLELLSSDRSIFDFGQQRSTDLTSTSVSGRIPYDRADEAEDLDRLLSKLQGWINEIGEWRDKEGFARTTEGQKEGNGRGGPRSRSKQANAQNDENWRRAQAQEEYFTIRRRCCNELCDFLIDTSRRLRPHVQTHLPDIPFARLWHCSAATHLQNLIDATPRCSLITQLNDPFRQLEDYGFLRSLPSRIISGGMEPHFGGRDGHASATALRALEASGHLPDVCRAYQLYLNSPRFLNLANWYSAFEQGVRASRAVLLLERPGVADQASDSDSRISVDIQTLTNSTSEGGDEASSPASPNRRSPRKRQTVTEHQDSPVKRRKTEKANPRANDGSRGLASRSPEQLDGISSGKDEDELQARFALAVNELAIMGLLKGTRRKVEHTTKVIFDLPLPS